jgi:hypothetical protein
VQSTENNSESRLSLEDIQDIWDRATSAASYGNQGFFVDSLIVVSEQDVPKLVAALAAERDRADHYLQVAAELQQRIVDAPHGRGCQQMEQATFVGRPDFCNCWKSEATA